MLQIIRQPMLTLPVLAGLLTLAGCQYQAAEVSQGVLVSAQKGKLVVNRAGGGICGFRLTDETRITLDGRRATWNELNRYPTVNVRIKHERASGVATEVDAVAEAVRHTAGKPIVPVSMVRRGSNSSTGSSGKIPRANRPTQPRKTQSCRRTCPPWTAWRRLKGKSYRSTKRDFCCAWAANNALCRFPTMRA